jgi:serine/threonine protein kinase
MGAVYRARQRRLDRVVRLKVLPPAPDRDDAFGERFEREARAMARLHHPNIVMVHDSGRAGGLYYFVMEHVDGANVRQMMDGGRLAPEQALAIVPQVCEALQYAHEQGIVHRDIKPENILVDRAGRVKIADFGVAKLVARPDTERTLTLPQQTLGTMHYMAPEQIEHSGEVDHRADIYALGVVLYEMLTGELPIGRFAPPSEKAPVDGRLDHVVLRALEKEPTRRYQAISEIRSDVEHMLVARSPAAPVMRAPAPSANVGIAYLCWCACFFGLSGLHRFYLGRWITGLVWLFTFGLLFLGQLVDLFLIPMMTRDRSRT